MRPLPLAVLAAATLAVGAGCANLSGLSDLTIGNCADGCEGDGSVVDANVPRDEAGNPLPTEAGDDATVDDAGTDDGGGASDGAADAKSDVGAGGGDAGGDAGSDASSGPCPGTAGPAPVRVGSFCIDSTEVTNDQYSAFLAAKPPLSLGPAACAFKTSFTPSTWPVAANKGSSPVAFVDWCDAYAYCAWAGKRLCGAIGGGPSSKANAGNKSIDQWYAACSMNGTYVYPYASNAWVQGKCNESETNTNGTRPVGSFTACQGGYSGLWDMNGNVWEWEDACDVSAGASDACMIRGGSWYFPGQTYGGCPTYFNDYVVKRSDTYNDTGFRCCSK